MICLSLETTTDISSIAITDGAEILGEYDFAHHMDLSQRLMTSIVNLLRDCRLEMSDLQAVGVSLGPGSFTGLRIGVVTAKTLAQTLCIPIAGIVTLDLLAHQFDYLPDALVCPLIKVRKGEVYYALYRALGGTLQRLTEYEAGPVDDVVKLISSPMPVNGEELGEGSPGITPSHLKGEGWGVGGDSVILCGDALKANLPALQEALSDRVIWAPEWLSYPKASILARLTFEKIEAGETSDPLTLVPFYIRRSAPEMKLGDSRGGLTATAE